MRTKVTCSVLSLFICSHSMLILQYTKRRLLVVDLVAAFVLFIFMLVLLRFFALLPFLGE